MHSHCYDQTIWTVKSKSDRHTAVAGRPGGAAQPCQRPGFIICCCKAGQLNVIQAVAYSHAAAVISVRGGSSPTYNNSRWHQRSVAQRVDGVPLGTAGNISTNSTCSRSQSAVQTWAAPTTVNMQHPPGRTGPPAWAAGAQAAAAGGPLPQTSPASAARAGLQGRKANSSHFGVQQAACGKLQLTRLVCSCFLIRQRQGARTAASHAQPQAACTHRPAPTKLVVIHCRHAAARLLNSCPRAVRHAADLWQGREGQAEVVEYQQQCMSAPICLQAHQQQVAPYPQSTKPHTQQQPQALSSTHRPLSLPAGAPASRSGRRRAPAAARPTPSCGPRSCCPAGPVGMGRKVGQSSSHASSVQAGLNGKAASGT